MDIDELWRSATEEKHLVRKVRITLLQDHYPSDRLISYGTSQTEAVRRMTGYVDNVLKGANPGTLRVEKVIRYELIVNLKTARDIGVTVPPDVIKKADRVIE